MPVQLKHKTISGFNFQQTIQKFATAQMTPANAVKIRRIIRALESARTKIYAAYKTDVIEVFAKRDDKNDIVRPEGEPDGFVPIEGKEAEFKTAQDAFGERTVELDCSPFIPQMMESMKISAGEIEALSEMWSDNDAPMGVETGPGVPLASNVKSLRQ